MATVTICSDFGAQENKVWHCFHCFPIYFPWSDGTRCGKGILYTAAYNYYYNTYSDNKSKSVQKIIKKNQILLDYIKSYSAVFPEIPQYLDQFGAKVKESMEIIKKMEDLDNPSAFD